MLTERALVGKALTPVDGPEGAKNSKDGQHRNNCLGS